MSFLLCVLVTSSIVLYLPYLFILFAPVYLCHQHSCYGLSVVSLLSIFNLTHHLFNTLLIYHTSSTSSLSCLCFFLSFSNSPHLPWPLTLIWIIISFQPFFLLFLSVSSTFLGLSLITHICTSHPHHHIHKSPPHVPLCVFNLPHPLCNTCTFHHHYHFSTPPHGTVMQW